MIRTGYQALSTSEPLTIQNTRLFTDTLPFEVWVDIFKHLSQLDYRRLALTGREGLQVFKKFKHIFTMTSVIGLSEEIASKIPSLPTFEPEPLPYNQKKMDERSLFWYRNIISWAKEPENIALLNGIDLRTQEGKAFQRLKHVFCFVSAIQLSSELKKIVSSFPCFMIQPIPYTQDKMNDKLLVWYQEIISWAKRPENAVHVQTLKTTKFKNIDSEIKSAEMGYSDLLTDCLLAVSENPLKIFDENYEYLIKNEPNKSLRDILGRKFIHLHTRFSFASSILTNAFCLDVIKNVNPNDYKSFPFNKFIYHIKFCSPLNSGILKLSDIRDTKLRFEVSRFHYYSKAEVATVVSDVKQNLSSRDQNQAISRVLYQANQEQSLKSFQIINVLNNDPELAIKVTHLTKSSTQYKLKRTCSRVSYIAIIAISLTVATITGAGSFFTINSEGNTKFVIGLGLLFVAFAALGIAAVAYKLKKNAAYQEVIHIV